MNRTALGLGVALVLAVGILSNIAQSIEVLPPSPVPALSPTQITITCDPDSFIVILGVVNGQLFIPEVADTSPGEFCFSGPPGSYAIVGQEQGKRFQQTVVIVGDKDDDDDEEPGPDPLPPPPGPRSVTVVYESANRTVELDAVTNVLQGYCRQKNHSYLAVDKDAKAKDGNQPAFLVKFKELASRDKIAMPLLCTVAAGSGEDETVVWVEELDLSPGKALKQLRAHGG